MKEKKLIKKENEKRKQKTNRKELEPRPKEMID